MEHMIRISVCYSMTYIHKALLFEENYFHIPYMASRWY